MISEYNASVFTQFTKKLVIGCLKYLPKVYYYLAHTYLKQLTALILIPLVRLSLLGTHGQTQAKALEAHMTEESHLITKKAKGKHCEGRQRKPGQMPLLCEHCAQSSYLTSARQQSVIIDSTQLNHTEFILPETWPETRFIKPYITLSSRLTPRSKGH